jgi:hypothetical protein
LGLLHSDLSVQGAGINFLLTVQFSRGLSARHFANTSPLPTLKFAFFFNRNVYWFLLLSMIVLL